jgi:hypothetical protein
MQNHLRAASSSQDTVENGRDSVSRLRPEKLHVTFLRGATPEGPITPRRYTLTHSDATGELYLGIGADYNRSQVSGWYARFLRDEVLAEWRDGAGGYGLYVHCHVSGGLVLGTVGWRDAIFRRELPLVLETFRYGDRGFFEKWPELDQANLWVRFHSSKRRYDRTESWGKPADYAPSKAVRA